MRAFNRKTAYYWYLNSRFWQERRRHAFILAKGTCEECKERKATQVHHLTYLRIFRELPTDLAALCETCHAKLHNSQAANDNEPQLSFAFPVKHAARE